MFLAGVRVNDDAVLELAGLVDDDALAARLERCVELEMRLVALDEHECELIGAALDDPPAGLAALRGALLADHVERKRLGM
ncbi:MAG: hypothetical protein U0R50_13005 [Gaiellales bacterium]